MTLPGQWNHDFAGEPICRLQEAREKALEDFLESGEIPGMTAESLALTLSGDLLCFIRDGRGALSLRCHAMECIEQHIEQTITEDYR